MEQYLNESFPLMGKGVSNSSQPLNLPRYRWCSIKEAFSPSIVNAAIEESNVRLGDLVVDPFSGCGTTPLTTAIKGITALAFEVNPYLTFVSKTKLLGAKRKTLLQATETTVSGIRNGVISPLEDFSTFSRAGGHAKWLFNLDVIRAFEGGWRRTDSFPYSARQLARLSLLSAAMDNCNASKDGKCLRYKKNWEKLGYGAESFERSFAERINTIMVDIEHQDVNRRLAKIIPGDCRTILSKNMSRKFKLCITSPPYLNSFDYSDIYRPELFLGRFVKSATELRKLRLRTLRSHVQVHWEKPVTNDFGTIYSSCIMGLAERTSLLWNKKIPLMVQAYFEDLYHLLHSLRKNAAHDASLWMVVSTSAYAGIEVPVDLILGEIGTKAGWYLKEIGVLRYLRTSGQHWHKWTVSENGKPKLRESVVIFSTHPVGR